MSNRVLEQQQRFSESFLWSAQREYYDKLGIEAWAGDVPFYITSNPFIAGIYAKVIIRFVQDWVRCHPESRHEPFYMIELGTGSGQFSFYLVKALMHMRKELQLEQIDLRYIMSDFTKNNVEFWQEHPTLQPYVKEGVLDFALFDVENDHEIHLLESGVTITENALKNPLIVFANYLFDSVLNDVFHVSDGKLYESLVSVSTPDDNLDGRVPKDWKKLDISYVDREVDGHYYDVPEFNQVLEYYRQHLNDARFLFPIASLRALRNLQKFSQQKMLLLSSDKGNTDLADLDDNDHPDLDFHGSFSVMVNFHAIAKYFECCEGDSYLQSHRDAITTNVFSSGFTLDKLVEARFAIAEHVKGFSAADYFNFYEHIEDEYDDCKLDMLTSLLNLSHWDPYVFDEVQKHLSELLDDADTDEENYLKDNLPRIAENYYYLPEANDTLFNIAILYQELGDYAPAIKYYELSRQFIQEGWEVMFNLGVCYFEIGEKQQALSCFQAAAGYDPRDKETKQWLKKFN